MNILQEILENKKFEVEKRKEEWPLETVKVRLRTAPLTKDFAKAISSGKNKIHIIAEIKKSSPSAGVIVKDFDPVKIAKIYAKNGAAAISVLTDARYFQTDIFDLKQVSDAVKLPILRKDFIIDEYQIYEARLFGADCILLIADILSEQEIEKFLQTAKKLNLECLVEVHNREDLDKVLQTSAQIIGINNRDLATFKVDLKTTAKLRSQIPAEKIVVSESGIKTPKDINFLKNIGVNAILIGTSLLTAKDIGKALKNLNKGGK